MNALTATYTGPSAEQAALLLLTQGEWSVYVGKVTKGEVVRFVSAAVTEEEYQATVDCGLAGDNLICPIIAYPLVPDLDYRLLTSWGELSARSVEMVEIRDEQVQFRLTTEATTEFPARAIRSVNWTMDCLDQTGEVVAPPTLTIEGQSIRSAAPVYGTATVHYITERHTYILNAPRRETAIDNNWSAVVVAPIIGYEPVRLVVEMPPGINNFEADPDAVCGRVGRGGGSVTFPEDPYYPPEPAGADLITEVDYCDQEVIQEYTR